MRERLHPLEVIEPIKHVTAGVLQTSEAVAVPQPGIVGLHPRFEPAGHKVNTGWVTSTTHVNVCKQVEKLLQASVAV